MTNPIYQDQLTLVNSNLIGTLNRTSAQFSGHPMVRTGWGTRDKFRGIMGAYFLEYEGPNGLALFNAGSTVQDGSPDTTDPVAGSVNTQFVGLNSSNDTNIIFSPTYTDGEYNTAPGFTLTLSKPAWEGYNNIATPYIENWFNETLSLTAQRLTELVGTSPALLPGGNMAPGLYPEAGIFYNNIEVPFWDHTTQIYAESSDTLIRDASDTYFSIVSTYEHYIPSYELATSNPNVPEHLIPNVYYLQLELENTSNTSLAQGRYEKAISLDEASLPPLPNGDDDTWFTSLDTSAPVQGETLNQRYYPLYASALSRANLTTLRGSIEKDLFVLYRDREILNEESVTIRKAPFYNTITIPTSGPSGRPGANILNSVSIYQNGEDFINMLQVAAIQSIQGHTHGTVEFKTQVKKITSADTADTFVNSTSEVNYPLVYDLINRYGDAAIMTTAPWPNSQAVVGLADHIEEDKPIGPAVSLHNRDPDNPILVSDQIVDASEEFENLSDQVKRPFSSIMRNDYCHTETLMYVIKKYRALDPPSATPLQTFYLTNSDFQEGSNIVYYDSQIKIEQRYRYSIERVLLIFGNEYEYLPFQIPPEPDPNDAQVDTTSNQGTGPTVPGYTPPIGYTGPSTSPAGFGPSIGPTLGSPSIGSNLGPPSIGPTLGSPSIGSNLGPPSIGPTLGSPSIGSNLGPPSIGSYGPAGAPDPPIPTPSFSAGAITFLLNNDLDWESRFIDLFNGPNVKAILVPYINGEVVTLSLDTPPVPPNISFYSFLGINNKIQILLNAGLGDISEPAVVILEQDKSFFVSEYLAQTGIQTSYDNIGNIEFRSSDADPVDAYQLFRLDSAPTSYSDFESGQLNAINPALGIPASFKDTILPNTKYYYCARSIDAHGNISNPTHIFEIEIVDNGGQIFLRQELYMFEAPTPRFQMSGQRFLYIEPSFQQLSLTDDPEVGDLDIELPPNDSILGAADVNTVWGETFKIRVSSKKTGRKLDLNLTFKNSGIVNPSE